MDLIEHSSPKKVLLVYIPILFFLFYIHIDNLKMGVILVFMGILLWTLAEYSVHKFIFHFPYKLKLWRDIVYYLHLNHHEYTKQEEIITLPIGITLLVSLFLSLIINPFILIGIILGYINYELTHYFIHFRIPKTRYGMYLRSHHFYHHYKDQNKNFSVTFPLWDYFFTK